jgi:hypothetical protein
MISFNLAKAVFWFICQIGLVDMLREEYGITPAGMLGHSAGEIPCGYADGCLTREQTILIAYHRGECKPSPPSCHADSASRMVMRNSAFYPIWQKSATVSIYGFKDAHLFSHHQSSQGLG